MLLDKLRGDQHADAGAEQRQGDLDKSKTINISLT